MVIESKSAEELALGMLWDERHRAKFYRQYAQSVAYEADCAASVFDLMSLRSAANRWHQVSYDHRRNVSILARIIRAIRAEKEETDTNPQPRDEMTNREKIIRINEIAMRCINAGPVSLETGIEKIREIVNGGTPDEPRAVPAEVEFDAEEITRIVDAAVDRIIKEHSPDLDKTTPLKPREETLRELQTDVHDLACEKGWWDGHQGFSRVLPDGTLSDVRMDMSTDQLLAKVSLIHAELSEAVEEARKSNDYGMYLGEGGKPEGFVVELADAVIRTLDLCGALGLDLEAAIVAKHEFNKTRPRRHGGKLA